MWVFCVLLASVVLWGENEVEQWAHYLTIPFSKTAFIWEVLCVGPAKVITTASKYNRSFLTGVGNFTSYSETQAESSTTQEAWYGKDGSEQEGQQVEEAGSNRPAGICGYSPAHRVDMQNNDSPSFSFITFLMRLHRTVNSFGLRPAWSWCSTAAGGCSWTTHDTSYQVTHGQQQTFLLLFPP